jgi:hypothetical protein
MLEMMLAKTAPGASFFPDSGPGTKTLQYGNRTLGYFGEVSGAELFFGWEIGQAVGLQVGGDYVTYSGSQWFKFFRNNKVIYISRQQLKLNISWTDLYNAGLVYGTKGNGLYPVGAGVEQFNPMRKFDGTRNWFLVPRLPTGMGIDPIASDTSDGGEWAQLFGRVVNVNNPNIAEKWALNSTAYVSSTGPGQLLSMVMETQSSNVANNWRRGGQGDLSSSAAIAKTTTSQWRPVLELIPDTTLLDPNPVTIEPYSLQPPAIVDVRTAQLNGTPGLLNPQNVVTSWPTKQPVITGVTFTGAALSPASVTISTAGNLNPFSIIGASDQLVSSPTNLTYSLADLNPFTISGANAA